MLTDRCDVYLVHLETPYKHAQHYLGSAPNARTRFAKHVANPDVRLLQAAKAAGIPLRLAAVWRATRADEARMKQRGPTRKGARGSLRPLCPLCGGTGRLPQPRVRRAPLLALTDGCADLLAA